MTAEATIAGSSVAMPSDDAPAPAPFKRRKWVMPTLLLAPTLALMVYAFILPLLVFMQFSFYRFTGGRLVEDFTFDTYRRFITDGYFQLIVFDTLRMAVYVTGLSVLVGYPLAYALCRSGPARSPGVARCSG